MVEDGIMRYPANSVVWNLLDKKYECFGQEVHNVRLGLAAEGFNPFRNMSLSYNR